jgi:lysozyme family protein
MGIKRAATFFQRGLNVLNRGEKLYPNIEVDGAVGPKTIAAFDALPSRDVAALEKIMNVLQGAYYVERMEADETQEKWVGWFNRV